VPAPGAAVPLGAISVLPLRGRGAVRAGTGVVNRCAYRSVNRVCPHTKTVEAVYGRSPRTPAYTRADPQTPADTRGHPRTPADTRAHPQTPAHTRGHPRTPADTRAHPRTPADNRGHPRTPADTPQAFKTIFHLGLKLWTRSKSWKSAQQDCRGCIWSEHTYTSHRVSAERCGHGLGL